MPAYYNEHDPMKAAVLREAINANAIALGDVDERSIKDVSAADLVGYTQCHFFAGGGFWSLAARKAGWPDDQPMWTGSCPCPSFSAAGKGGGFSDARHLWPDWARLIPKCKPPVIFGEQADDAIGYGWLDLVQTDLEAQAYAVGKAVLGAASVGAPHIRQRLYFVADTEEAERGRTGNARIGRRRNQEVGGSSVSCQLEHALGTGSQGHARHGTDGDQSRWFGAQPSGSIAEAGEPSTLGHSGETERRARTERNGYFHRQEGRWQQSPSLPREPSPVSGFWRDAEWIPCRVPKLPGAIVWRAIERGTFVLAARYPERVAELRIAGDAINVEVAAAFIEAYQSSL